MPVTARVCVNQAAAHYREAELFLEQLRQNRGRNQRGQLEVMPGGGWVVGRWEWAQRVKTGEPQWGLSGQEPVRE